MKVRLISVFVSSPNDVAEERRVLDEIVDSINRSDGKAGGFRLELFKWEDDVTPQIGPKPQKVVDQQTPEYDVYLGIMSTRFGTPTGRYGSGTEKEFKDALRKWKKAGSPWITFYFNDAPAVSRKPDEARQFVRVCELREDLESKGIVLGYTGVRGNKDAFYEKVSTHLRKCAVDHASGTGTSRGKRARCEVRGGRGEPVGADLTGPAGNRLAVRSGSVRFGQIHFLPLGRLVGL